MRNSDQSKNRADRRKLIQQALNNNRHFLAYFKANSLLHDLDKISEKFLQWSMVPRRSQGQIEKDTGYPGHDVFHMQRAAFQEKLGIKIPAGDLAVALPVKAVAVAPGRLRKCFQGDLAGLIADKENFGDCRDNFTSKKTDWPGKAVPGRSLFDIYQYHHDPEIYLKSSATVPGVLLFFAAGTAGIDGHDTRYETGAAKESNQAESHKPDTLSDKRLLIATPFGHEVSHPITAAAAKAEHLDLSEKINRVHKAIREQNDPFPALSEQENCIRQCGKLTTIRTGRPQNDVTLADHAISTAALALAHGARIAIEGINPAEVNACYAAPARGSHLTDSTDGEKGWPATEFAIFSLAVNSDRLDSMAMDLPDITAIRQEVRKLFSFIAELFSCTHPVGGEVYRDQHGIHLVVPVLGNPARRWLQAGNDTDYQWLGDKNGISNDDLREWLMATAAQAIHAEEFCFDRELLLAMRYARIGDELNRLSEAIAWSRTIAGISSGISIKTGRHEVRFQNYAGPIRFTEQPGELCSVCGLRFQDKNNSRRKCGLCALRAEQHRNPSPDFRETMDLTDIAAGSEDKRLALVSIAFDLSPWLSERENSGIFCWNKDWIIADSSSLATRYTKTKNYKKLLKLQRLNSFGRFRRIWRTSEDFLRNQRDRAREITAYGENRARMRTILKQPQNLQIIMPAQQAGQFLDQLLADLFKEFGRVISRLAINVSALLFPFRVPVYLMLEADRALKGWALATGQVEEKLRRKNGHFQIEHDFDDRIFRSQVRLPFGQDHQPKGCNLKGMDRIHANIITAEDEKWHFLGDLGQAESTPVKMTTNRFCLAEINSGFALNRISAPSPPSRPSFCHDIPLEHWFALQRLSELEKPISAGKRRSLRTELALREQIWADHISSYDDKRLFCELFWREPGRYGAKAWAALTSEEQDLLIDSCLNGGLYLAALIRKHLYQDNNEDIL